MLPKESPLARDQFRKLHVYAGADHPHMAQQPKVLDLAAANPKNKSPISVLYWDYPEAHMNDVEDEGQADGHQDHTGPNCPLAGFVRDFQSGENSGLQIFGLENVRRRRVLGNA